MSRMEMKFKIGARAYEVVRVWDLRCDGEPVEGLCSYAPRRIYLDGDLAADMVEGVLRHEHVHAWECEVGIPATAEDRARLNSTAGAAFDAEFVAQGGNPVLMSLPIEGTRKTVEKELTRYFGISDQMECGSCGTRLMAGSIATSEPRKLASAGILVVDRGFLCSVCGKVQTWMEQCSEEGVPVGGFIRPQLLSGEKAAQWVAEARKAGAVVFD